MLLYIVLLLRTCTIIKSMNWIKTIFIASQIKIIFIRKIKFCFFVNLNTQLRVVSYSCGCNNAIPCMDRYLEGFVCVSLHILTKLCDPNSFQI